MWPGKISAYHVLFYAIPCAFMVSRAALFPLRVYANPGPVSEAAFWEKLRQTRAMVADLRDLPEAEVCAAFQSEVETWADVREVRLDSGTVIPVRAEWLIAGLGKCPPEVDLLLNRIDALLDAENNHRISGSPIAFDAGPLQGILSQKEFQAYAESANKEDPLQALWKFLRDWLNKELNRVQIPEGFVWILGLSATVLLLGILFLAYRLLTRNIAQQVDAGPAGALTPGLLTSEQAVVLAQEKSLVGNRRLAIRYLYLSALLFLEEHGYLSYNRSLTNQEYVRSIAHLPHLATPLQRIVNVFDRVWYGFQIPSEKEYRDYLDLVNGIRRNS